MTTESRKSKVVSVLEQVVVVAILLVLVQSFFEDVAELLNWSWLTRRTLLISAFVFDAFFSIEFLTRFYFAFVKRRGAQYFVHERGWIDFVASIPLLLLNSGPQVMAIAVGGSAIFGAGRILNLLKVIKAIRIARILRLLRALKLFRKIKHTDSVMTQRHVSRLATLVVTTFVVVIFAFNAVDALVDFRGLDRTFRESTLGTAAAVDGMDLSVNAQSGEFSRLTGRNEEVLVVREGGETRFSRYDNRFYAEQFGPADYTYQRSGNIEVFLSLRPILQSQARDSLVYFFIILATVAVLLLVYGPYFCMTVSDPSYVMTRGMREPSYNLQVQVPEGLEEDEVFMLAREYNAVYLPLKDRARSEGGDASELQMDNVEDLFTDYPDQ